ncbi:hypothetical protein [Lysobacter gummosus]
MRPRRSDAYRYISLANDFDQRKWACNKRCRTHEHMHKASGYSAEKSQR